MLNLWSCHQVSASSCCPIASQTAHLTAVGQWTIMIAKSSFALIHWFFPLIFRYLVQPSPGWYQGLGLWNTSSDLAGGSDPNPRKFQVRAEKERSWMPSLMSHIEEYLNQEALVLRWGLLRLWMFDRWKTAIFCKKSIFAVGVNDRKKELYDYFMDCFFLNHFCCGLHSRTFTASVNPWQPMSSYTEITLPFLPCISGAWDCPLGSLVLEVMSQHPVRKFCLAPDLTHLQSKLFSVDVFCPTLQLARRTSKADTWIRNKTAPTFPNYFWPDLSAHELRRADH